MDFTQSPLRRQAFKAAAFSTSFKPSRLALLIGLAVLHLPARADDPVRDYHIPAQALNGGLLKLAADSGLEILFAADQVRGKLSQDLDGSMTPTQALSRLLQGSGMTYRFVDAKTVTVERPAGNDEKAVEPQSATLPAVKVNGTAEYAPYDPYNPSYNTPNASTATKTDTPIMETPLAIKVVPQQVLKDQQVTRLEDVYRNVSGVQAGFGYSNFYDDAFIRGFPINGNIFRNGFRQRYYNFDAADLEQVEILKGSAAVMFGRVEPGGIINQVPKKPLSEPYYVLQQQFGSYDFYRTTLDATGPITGDKSLRYRFNGAYVNADSFRDVGLEKVYLAPTLSWQITPDTEVNLLLNYQHQDTELDEGVPGQGNRPADVPLSRNYCDDECRLKHDQTVLYLNWSHRFNDYLTLRNGFSGGWEEDYIQELGQGTVNAAGNFRQFPWLYDEEATHYQTYLDLNGKFEWLGTRHNALVGVDYYVRDFKQGFRGGDALTRHIDDTRPDVFDFGAFAAQGFNEFYPSRDEWFGVYFQDQITLFDKLHILGGGRYDWASSKSGFSTVSSEAADLTGTHTGFFSPRVGILYRPVKWFSVYGNYVESLGSNNGGRAFDGKPFAPEISEQYEAGIKTEFFDGRLNASLAYFHLTKQNILTADLEHLDQGSFSKAIGAARSQGIEFDMTGQLTDRFSLIANYAYTDAGITKSNDTAPHLSVGAPLPMVPEHSGSLWAKYSLIPNRFEIGAGPYLAGPRHGFGPLVELPGYVRLDAYAAYHVKIGDSRLTTQVNINNLLDKDYFKTLAFGQGGLPGEPLTVMGSVRLEY